jgi:L-aspartate oxidase
VAGAFLSDPQAVEVVCREGPARVMDLVALGAEFTRNKDGSLHLTREGGHGNRRIVHAADLTGAEVERALLAAARSHPNIHFYEHHLATDLVVDDVASSSSLSGPSGVQRHCFGVDVLDQKSMEMCRFIGMSTMLASGGAGQVYPKTTNPHVATGDGIAMAYRAGAVISNMEFVQFHPTALYTPEGPGAGGRTSLITEAVRGEGGRLYNSRGERFMETYDSRLELAPRDIVARAIQEQMRLHDQPHVLLDISHRPRDEVLSHFPNIAKRCAEIGVDITKEPIPVVPAQHYTCGGVQTGLQGETCIQGLFACGEVACSGLHGANRLASNSLLEGLVFADRAVGPSVAHAEYSLQHCTRQIQRAVAKVDGPSGVFEGARGAKTLPPYLSAWIEDRRKDLTSAMWHSLGIVRTSGEMYDALGFVSSLGLEARSLLSNSGVSTEAVELSNLATVAELIASCALQRRESRGGHFVLDFPESVESERKPSLLQLNRDKAAGGFPSHRLKYAQPASLKGKQGASMTSTPLKQAQPRESMAVRSLPPQQDGG